MTQEKSLTAPVTGLTPAMAVAIFKRQYPGVPEAEIMKAGLICYNYKLFPYGNQVFIIPFQKKDKDTNRYIETWVTVIGIKGLREIAKNTGNRFSYLNGDGPRVMTQEEETQIYGSPDPTYIRAIVKIKNDRNEVFPGYGNFKRSDTPYGSDKGNTGFNMAFIRAERNAIDRMAPGALPDADIIDESFVDAPVSQIVQAGEKQLAIQNERDVKELWPGLPDGEGVKP